MPHLSPGTLTAKRVITHLDDNPLVSHGGESLVWSLESGVWSLESGVWSLESGVVHP